jgi:hypothetical protein
MLLGQAETVGAGWRKVDQFLDRIRAVTAKDVQRGTVWPGQTNEEGIYAFPRIPAGTYELRVEAKGFKTAVRADIVLEVNQRARLDMVLELGAVAEVVEVTGEAPLLNTETTIVGSTLTANSIVTVPLVSRNFVSLTLLAPGVTTTNPADFNSGARTGGGGRPYVNGNRKRRITFSSKESTTITPPTTWLPTSPTWTPSRKSR